MTGGRNWRTYAGPAAFLLVATIVVALLRSQLGGHAHVTAPLTPAPAHAKAHSHRPVHRLYVVRAGDTIAAISVKTRVPPTKILALNPKASPTALFIGERLRLR